MKSITIFAFPIINTTCKIIIFVPCESTFWSTSVPQSISSCTCNISQNYFPHFPMRVFRGLHEPINQSNSIHKIRSSCSQVHQTSYHFFLERRIHRWSIILLTQFCACSDGGFCCPTFIHPEPCQNICSILMLTYEDSLVTLVNLKTQKIPHKTHISHLKLLLHDWFKFLRNQISSINHIININTY